MFYQAAWSTVGQAIRVAFRARIEGKRNVPRKGPAILASNHLSFLDHLLVPLATRRQIYFVSKAEHFDPPFRRWFFQHIGVIPLRRGEGDSEAFDRSLEAIRGGHLFCIYPEGTRSRDGKLHKGHTGVARLAFLTGAPVVPVAMIGTFEAMPKGTRLPKLRKCTVRIGTPIEFERDEDKAANRSQLRQRTDEIMAAVARLSGQEYVDTYQTNPEIRTHSADGSQDGDGLRSTAR